MKFDLTKNVRLAPAWEKYYLAARISVLVVFHLFFIYFFNQTFFPDENFAVNLKNPSAKENSIGHYPYSAQEDIFSAYSRDVFSTATFQVIAGKNSKDLSGQKISVRKTYAAFAYPTAENPASFPDGSLLKNSGNYYLVSGGQLRRFASPQISKALGYTEESFQEATDEELSYNVLGTDITATQNYADNSLFLIDETYYQLENQTLFPFVSENAFLSRYSKNQAVSQNQSFLQNYPIDQDNPIGFASGSLLSFDVGVFLVVEDRVMPFNNPLTFLAYGYVWEDVIPATEEEIGLYQRDKVISIDQPHPNRTVFYAADSQKYYLVDGEGKKEIKGKNILKNYLKRQPIIANKSSLEFQNECRLKKSLWPLNSYRCEIPIKNLESFAGKDYQFKMQAALNTKISAAEIVLSREANWKNMRDILSVIKQRLLANYGYGEPTN